MKILLLSPILRHSGGKPKNTHQPPLALAYLAANLLKHGHEVKIVDFYSEELWKKRKKLIGGYRPDIVGVSAKTTAYLEAVDLVKKAKEFGLLTVIGGPHPTATPETVLKTAPVDALFIGEAEETFAEFADNLAQKKKDFSINGVVRIIRGKAFWPTQTWPKPVDLDKIPFPARHLLDNVYTPYIDSKDGRIDAEAMIASRGCLGICSFCHVKGRSGWTGRSIKLVVEEMSLLLEQSRKQGIYFNDLFLAGSKEWTVRLCKEILKRRLKVFWTCETRVDNFDKELASYMAKAGCVRASFGVETLNDNLLKGVNKQTSVEQIEKAVKNASRSGILPYLQMIIGLPGETKTTINQTTGLLDKWIEKYGIYVAGFGPLWLYPGTALFQKFGDQQHDWLRTVSSGTIFPNVPLYSPPTLSQGFVVKTCRDLTEKYRKLIAQKYPISYKDITDYEIY